MKGFIAISFLVLSFTAVAGIKEDVKPFLGLDGTAIENNVQVGRCRIELANDNLVMSGGFYSDSSVELKATPIGTQEYLSSATGKRPGGDACGDFGGMSGYKKILSIKGKSVKISQTFRCFMRKESYVSECAF